MSNENKETNWVEIQTPEMVMKFPYDELEQKYKVVKEKLEQIRKLHQPYEWDLQQDCVVCVETEYPCETIKILWGEYNE